MRSTSSTATNERVEYCHDQPQARSSNAGRRRSRDANPASLCARGRHRCRTGSSAAMTPSVDEGTSSPTWSAVRAALRDELAGVLADRREEGYMFPTRTGRRVSPENFRNRIRRRPQTRRCRTG